MTAPNEPKRGSTAYLLAHMLRSLPDGDEPSLRNAWDAVALFAHVSMLSGGFRLVGLGEDDRIGTKDRGTGYDRRLIFDRRHKLHRY